VLPGGQETQETQDNLLDKTGVDVVELKLAGE